MKCCQKRCYWPTDRYSTFLYLLPLGVFALLMVLILATWGTLEIVRSSLQHEFSWSEGCRMMLGAYKVIIAIGGLLAVVRSSVKGAQMLLVGSNVLAVALTAEFVAQWAIWIMEIGGFGITHVKRIPSPLDITIMVSATVGFIIFIILTFTYFSSLLRSLKAVLNAGGTGFERKAYFQIEATFTEKSLQCMLYNIPPDISPSHQSSKYLVNNHRRHHLDEPSHHNDNKKSHHHLPPHSSYFDNPHSKYDGLQSLSTATTIHHNSSKQLHQHQQPQSHFVIKPTKSINNLANLPPVILAPADIHRESIRTVPYPPQPN